MRLILSRVLALFERGRHDAALDDEIRAHLDLLAADYERRGVSPADARLAARRAFGGVEPMKERYRDLLRPPLIDDLCRDVSHAARALRRAPAFTCVAVVTLALGIGANTAIFSVLEALLLRPLAVRDAHELVQIVTVSDGRPTAFSYPAIQEIERRRLFDGVFGFHRGATYTAGESGALEQVSVALVTGGYYETLGVAPAVGRLIRDDDDRPGAQPVVVLGHGYWQRKFAGDPEIVGRSIRIEGVPVTVAGVDPPDFTGVVVGRPADLTLPIGVLPQVRPVQQIMLEATSAQWYVMGRLPDGMKSSDLARRLAALRRELIEATLLPSPRRDRALADAITLAPAGTGWAALRERFESPLIVLMAMVSGVLVIACANVANLLLARTTARQRELSVRLALGAGRARIVRQILTESLLLSSAGSVLAVGAAWFGSRALLSLIQRGESRPVLIDVAPDGRVLAVTAGLAVVTALLFGAVPAWRSASLKASGEARDPERMIHSRGRLGPALVAVQVALSVLLLVAGGLFVRTLQNLRGLDAGFRHDHVLTFMVTPPDDARSAAGAAFLESISAAVRRVPGVRAVSFAGATPLSGGSIRMPFEVRGESTGDPILTHYIAPGYVNAMRMALRAGRDFTAADRDGAPLVAIVNDEFARLYLRGRDPLSQSVAIALRGKSRVERPVVGVVGGAVHDDLRIPAPAAVYLPFAQMSSGPAFFGAGTYAVLVSPSFTRTGAIRDAVGALVPGPAIEVRSLTDQVERTIVQERLMALLAGAFAVLALVLAAVGLYGLLSYTVTQRTNELGVRMAIGAGPRDVIHLVMHDAGWMVALGIAAGLPLAWIASRSVRTMLFRLEPTDPSTIGTALAILALAAAVAAYLPARRATRVDPVIALRAE